MDEKGLEAILGFDDEALAANRDGRLSTYQRGRLAWSGLWRLVAGPILLIVAAVLAWVAGLAFLAIIALSVAGYGLYLVWRGFAFLADAYDGAVAYVTGPLRQHIVRTRNGTTYWADVGPVSKSVRRAAYDALPVGLDCHLYYSPGCRSLLSIEPATADEPKPTHPFGPDSAHAWNRLRGSWVLLATGVLGVLIGLHTISAAHAAHPVSVGGTITNYVETHGKTTTRDLYLNGNLYIPQREDTYVPAAPPFGSLVGDKIVLYVDAGTNNVLALDDREVLYASDWYLHPEHETTFDLANGAIVLAAGLTAVIAAAAIIRTSRRSSEGPEAAPTYTPPTVRPLLKSWPGAVLLVGMSVLAVLGIAFGTHS